MSRTYGNRTYVSPTLVTLDATVPHPGFSPFAAAKAAREAQAKLDRMDLTMAEQLGVAWALMGATPREPLSPELAALVATIRKAGRP
jgi:hypothetical protein